MAILSYGDRLSGAGLLLNTFVRLATVKVGFSQSNVLAAGVHLPSKRYDSARSLLFHRQLIEEMRGMPAVLEVSAADYLPLQAVMMPYQFIGRWDGEKTPRDTGEKCRGKLFQGPRCASGSRSRVQAGGRHAISRAGCP